jgi:hypothetical protein
MMTHRSLITRSLRRISLALIATLTTLLLLCGALTIAQLSAEAAPSARPATNPLLGIDLPVGATLDRLPPGVRDYIRRTWPGLLPPPTTNPELGIDLPVGAQPEDLPPGVREYLREDAAGPPR